VEEKIWGSLDIPRLVMCRGCTAYAARRSSAAYTTFSRRFGILIARLPWSGNTIDGATSLN